ncbi:hypothetical protein V6C27_05135 [Peptococcaceae bacterium 1198_IL3148]
MTKGVVFPEFIGESDEALVLVLPTLKEELSDLFTKFHAGEEINYSFTWELLEVNDDDFLVVLDIDWEEGIGIGIGFGPEMWEIFRTVTSKQHIILMCDWEVVTMGVTKKIDEEEFKPHALLIRDANRGLWRLLDQAEELEPNEEQKEIVEYLYDVLGEVHTQKFLLH